MKSIVVSLFFLVSLPVVAQQKIPKMLDNTIVIDTI